MRVQVEKQIHRWDDISHHGSPYYACACCGVDRTKENSKELCDKTTEVAQQEADRVFYQEQREYKRIRYLLDKFEGKGGQ